MLKILTVNCNSIRTRYKGLMLGEIHGDFKVSVCVITETRLRRERVGGARFPNYNFVTEKRRNIKTKIGDKY